jgi:hypothetical protein
MAFGFHSAEAIGVDGRPGVVLCASNRDTAMA